MPDDDKAPWTIKAMPQSARETATRQAKQTGQTVAEWLATAIQHQADRELRSTVIPPGKPGQTVAVLDPASPPSPPLDLAALADAVRAATGVAQAAAEAPALRGLSRDVAGLLRDQVRLARGLAPMGRRREG